MQIYANKKTYLAHFETPHFEAYKDTTKNKVMSLEFVDVVSVVRASKWE